MLPRVQSYIQKHHLLSGSAPVLVALSGGADSVCLMRILHELGYTVVAAHCNFHLRGAESDRDEQFVRRLCETLGVTLHVRSFQTERYAEEHGVSIEMAARELRYSWFEELRKETGCEAVCVAHHKNDQAETLLLNLKRGTGFRGLEGMKPKNGFIVRPLLCMTRAQILAYCENRHYTFVTDSTNADTTIRRNGIRAMLQSFPEQEIEHIAHTAELMQQYELLLEALLKQQPVPEEAEPALLYELVAPYGFHPTQIEAMLSALPLSGKRFEAQHFEAVIDHGELHVTSKEPETPQPEPAIIRAVRPRLAKEHYPAATDDFALFDADILPERLMLRHWREGDCFYPITNTGRAPKKKLQDFFSDLKLSVKQKNRTWLLCDADQPEEIIWVIGLRISDKYKITPDTRRVTEIQIETT